MARFPASPFWPRDHFVMSFVKAAIANQDPQGEVAQPGLHATLASTIDEGYSEG